MKQNDKSYIIDWEYVGVGGVRGYELRMDLKNSNLIIGTPHLSDSWKGQYLAALWDFVEDHQPSDIFYTTDASAEILLFLRREGRELRSLGQSIQVSHYKVMERIFKNTLSVLNLDELQRQKMLDHYFLELPLNSWLISERARWFPAYLKANQYNQEVIQKAQFEWAYEMLQFYDFFQKLDSDPQYIKINPSAQVIAHEKNLVVLYLNQFQNQVLVLKLEPDMARVLDMLSEDRKFSQVQLVEMLMFENQSRSADFWNQLIADMKLAQIIY